jgi:(p)ppGpp synthase/HD superfamily hydrolase
MTEEERVIIVKLADRLHNMRTLSSMKPQKQRRIAEETLQVFVPLAKLLGMYRVKDELEALAFRWSDPESHAELLRWFVVDEAEGGTFACRMRLCHGIAMALRKVADGLPPELACRS